MANTYIYLTCAILLCELLLLRISKVNEKVFAVVIITIGLIGMVLAIVGHYGQYGFNLKWFLTLELPLYIFCGWAIAKGIIKPITMLFKKK